MSVGRWRLVAVSALAVLGLAACGAATGPLEPTPTPTAPTTAASPEPRPSPSTTSASPTTVARSGLTLRQLGFENGPLDEFSLPRDLVVATSVDQPNVVTIVLSRPSPATVEDYLRATLPGEGFTIDARSGSGQAMTFTGHGWTGGFTGTGRTAAIVLRPA